MVAGGGGEVEGGERRRNVEGSAGATVVVEEKQQVHIPKYTPTDQDVLWASRCMIATVLDGEAIPVLQRRIYDAGFENLDIISMGADKVLLKTEDESDVNVILSEAASFFASFFTNIVKWKKEVVFRERGAWVRIYGVPLQAWNL